jgi:hypothetical protein
MMPFAHTGILHSSMLEISSGHWSKTFSVLLQKIPEEPQIKMLGTTARDSPNGEKSKT